MSEHPSTLLGPAVDAAVRPLQRGYLNDESWAVRELALLRRDVRGTSVETWDLLYRRLPPALFGRGDAISPAERSFAAALHLYALHQQGRTRPMHSAGPSLGAAVRHLAREMDAESAVMRRFKTLGAASTWDGQMHHLRALIGQLKSTDGGIGLDYGRLASDLLRLQDPRTSDRVRQAWVRDIHRPAPSAPTDITSPATPATEGTTP